jgi:hypothetical protein
MQPSLTSDLSRRRRPRYLPLVHPPQPVSLRRPAGAPVSRSAANLCRNESGQWRDGAKQVERRNRGAPYRTIPRRPGCRLDVPVGDAPTLGSPFWTRLPTPVFPRRGAGACRGAIDILGCSPPDRCNVASCGRRSLVGGVLATASRCRPSPTSGQTLIVNAEATLHGSRLRAPASGRASDGELSTTCLMPHGAGASVEMREGRPARRSTDGSLH